MSDPYWQGSRLPALLIAFFLLLMFLVAFGFGRGIIDSLYGWARGLHIWQSPLWRAWKVLIIILVVVGSLIVLLAYLRYDGQKEQQAVRVYAESQGWGFSRWDETHDLKTRVERIFRDFRFDEPYWIRTVEAGSRTIVLFNCSYKHRNASGRSHSVNKIACLLQSEQFRIPGSPLTIGIREWRGDMLSLLRWDEVAMENPLFTEKFLVLSDDPTTAREIVNESMQSTLLEYVSRSEYTPASITIGPGGTVAMAEQDLKHERLPDLVDLVRRIERTVKR